MPLIIVALGILALLFLIMGLKLNTFISLLVVSFGVALALGMPFDKVVSSIEAGIGGTLGHIALIFGLGAMLGKLIADSGGAQRIAMTLVNKFGEKNIQWAVVIASFIIGIALFFEVGLVLLIPIVFAISRELKISILFLGIPMVAALSVTHGFLPPHPGPTAIAGEYGANIGEVLLYGFIVAVPTVLIAGPLFTKFAKKIVPASFAKNGNIASLGTQKTFNLEETPGFGISVFTAMLPIIIMSVATIIDLLQETIGFADNGVLAFIRLIGNASTAMIISLLVAVYTMGIKRNIPVKTVMDSCSTAISQIGMMLLIIGGGGAFKQVLINGGVGDYVADLFKGTALSPIILAWLIAAILRISLGSATVAALSTTGLVIPLLGHSDVNLALVVLATGAGSVIASHVNDAGFWMFKEYFGLSMKETFATWTLLETIISVAGLGFILLLSLVV
ncbi:MULTISPECIES: gluconate permease GntP [Bacillus]|jgi:GntP family gluconate:H+ symporter|uniref:Gluconate permease n=3 Tax=Bacillus subtilis subsp. subtilis TaxID=135461 RepID=GNTP_BACSU|nr:MULTISPECIES: gluconate permease GntP [Bacillales]NP_391887.1 gluconate/proton permease [Bacillus subtilis subsp. subtilis str. 168]P12012.1 RecName: Full=Gluconate permease [Bacillus subtilis subsp. subtilis str. 168]AOL31728.1 gluconate permease [Alkalicoccobacillus gibsonii]AXC55006.1 gluconate permease [Bacillus spizizenii]MBG9709258.1 gluconate permease [Lysinibacillus sphaericus]MBW4825737.1 gluconate permease GntP [Bacillaceae bacterium]MDP4122771.1 gluconate permease GntP [Bacillo